MAQLRSVVGKLFGCLREKSKSTVLRSFAAGGVTWSTERFAILLIKYFTFYTKMIYHRRAINREGI